MLGISTTKVKVFENLGAMEKKFISALFSLLAYFNKKSGTKLNLFVNFYILAISRNFNWLTSNQNSYYHKYFN